MGGAPERTRDSSVKTAHRRSHAPAQQWECSARGRRGSHGGGSHSPLWKKQEVIGRGEYRIRTKRAGGREGEGG